MRISVIKAAVVCALLAFTVPAAAQERLARFEGGIGVVPARSGGAANLARGVSPGGAPWVIARLSADVREDRISVDGRGLLLGGGDNIGRTGGQSVGARLFCNGTGPTFADATSHLSVLVLLEPDGDFRIESQLTPPPPRQCDNAVLLIVNAGGSWFAAGIPKQ
jgi:hypothetical protein